MILGFFLVTPFIQALLAPELDTIRGYTDQAFCDG